MTVSSLEERPSLGGYVRERILRGIYEGRFLPGARVRESDVCTWLNVSRTPVREAIVSLIAEGFLVALPARGTVVNQLDRQQIIEIYALRISLEGTAARLATQFMSDPDIDFLEELVSRSEKAENDPKRQAQLNTSFHSTIYTAAHNRYLMTALKSSSSWLALLRGTGYSVPGRASSAHEEHRAIIRAFRLRDGEAVEKAARDHIREAERARLRIVFDSL